MERSHPFRVLCLDGGGMRGVYQTTYLNTFTERLCASTGRSNEIDIGRSFNLIVGTSTGGIVACALAAGVPLVEVSKLYFEHGQQIFPYQLARSLPCIGKFVRFLGLGLHRGNAALRSILIDTLGYSTIESVYADRGIALAIPTV